MNLHLHPPTHIVAIFCNNFYISLIIHHKIIMFALVSCPPCHIPGKKALSLPLLLHERSVSADGSMIGYPWHILSIATRDFRCGGRQPRQPLLPGLLLQPLVVPQHGQVQQDATYPIVIGVIVCLVDDVGQTTIAPPSSATM
jgi:hypothetical protein